jgi:hypothetical protein
VLGVAISATANFAWAQESEPNEIPQGIKAKPVASKRISDEASSSNQLSFGAMSKKKIADAPRKSAARTAEGDAEKEDGDGAVVQAFAKNTSERGSIRRVGGTPDGDVQPAQWTASRTRSVLVNSPQEQDPPSAPAAPRTGAPAARPQPPGSRQLRADCGSEVMACEEARKKVFGNTIDKVQIDLSPLLFSEEDFKSLDAMIEASERLTREGLKDSPFRSWTDRSGKVVAQNSRLLRVRAHEIIVVDAAGVQQSLRIDDLSENDLCEAGDIWGIPVRCRLHEELYAGRTFVPTTFTWTASALCHKPNYFEQIELERYGHTPGPILEAPMAGAKFALDIATLPYKMGINPPNECRYALGYYRPGNCAPWIVPPVPLSLRGAIFQTAAVTGVSWIIP